MRRYAAALLLIVPAFAERATNYEVLKAEARQAQVAGDYRKASGKYAELLTLAEQSNPGAYEVYANVVSPLAEMYRVMEETDKIEELYIHRVEHAAKTHTDDGLELGLAQADLGFHYQHSDVSADRFRGERLILDAIKTFEHCSASKQISDQCRRRLADTAGIQGAIYFQNLDYTHAEPLFRRVISVPEELVQAEVLFVSLHALRGILILRKENDEARALASRAAQVEAKNQDALARLRGTSESGARSRTR